jgi:raffinose/stachyose/melibiose transport system permease protein
MKKLSLVNMSYFKNRFGVVVKYILVTFMSLLALYPFLWVANSGFKSNQEIYMNSFGLPREWKIDNYTRAVMSNSLRTGFRNSIIVTASVLTTVVILGSMVSYVIARVLPRNKWLYLYFTVGIMIPMTSVLIPVFLMLRQIGLLNSLMGLIVIYSACQMSMTVFVLTGFLRGIPREIEEAAIIDGASRLQAFFKIVFPLSKPGIATVCTLVFIYCWNEYVLATIITGSGRLRTIIVAVYMSKVEMQIDYGMLCANLVMSILPVVIFYLLFQEQVIKGMTAGSVKS